MHFKIDTYYNIPTITVNTPNATVENAGQLKNILAESFSVERNKIIIDMSCVKYIDSTFLGVIFQYLKLTQKSGGNLKLVTCEGCGNHPIWVMLETTGVAKLFEIYNSVDEALKSYEEN